MDHSHSPALDRLIRRQRVSDPSLPVSDSSSQAPGGGADSSTSTSTAPISTTTSSPAPVASTTTTSSVAPITSSAVQSSVIESSTSSSTTTTPVQVTSETSSSTTTTTTTTPAAVTSSSTTSTSSTTLRQVTSAEEAETATSTSARTTVVIVSGSASSTSQSSASLASSTAGSSSDSSIGTGGVIGIVAGAVVGVVFVAALIAFLFKKYSRKDDDDQISPFDKDEFRRASVMLDDDDQHYAHSLNSYRGGGGGGAGGMGHSPQMSEYSMSNVGVGAILPGLARGNTLQSPRPPTQLMNHYQQQQMMPSFQPGQVVLPNSPNSNNGNNPYAQQFPNNGSPPLGQYAPMDPYANQYNGMLPQHPQHPQPVHQQYDQSGLSAGQWNGGGGGGGMVPQNLSRANSQVSSYSQFSDSGSNGQHQQQGGGSGSRSILPPALRSGGPSSHGHPDERPLSQVQEDDESFEYVHQQERSGTPTNSNVQQTFFGREGVSAERGEWNEGEEERRRRLSIRNGGLDRDDPYDGIN